MLGATLLVILVLIWCGGWAKVAIAVDNEILSLGATIMAFMPGILLVAAMISH